MRTTPEIQEEIRHYQKKLSKLEKLKKAKADIGYVAEDVAMKDRIRLLKWVIEEEE
jgi:hypothetical protein